MARKINSRLIIKGNLEAKTPLHVGGYGVDVDTDLPLSRNGKGEFYVPGTSLTGVLRTWCERSFIQFDENGNPRKDKQGRNIPQEIIKAIFGFQETDKNKVGTNQDKSHASFVLIEDAKVTLPKGLQTEIRDGVGIDRIYGTAADKSKFDRAILPKGSQLEFEMTVEIQKDEAQTKAIIGHLLLALENEEIRFGASKTRGLGLVKFELKYAGEEKFSNFDKEKGESILDLFDESKKVKHSILKLVNADVDTKPNSSDSRLKITVEWHPTLPLMNKSGYEGIGVDMLPVTSGFGEEKLSLVLAGSSIKGAFRSQAERIMRTLLYKTAENKDLSDQIKDIPIVEELFGAKKEKTSKNPKLGLGAISVDDCYSVESFNHQHWREVEQASSDENGQYTNFLQKLGRMEKPNLSFYPTIHTAIDRFTGGVADGALYSVLAPHNIDWQPIELNLDFGRTENKKPCLMLLLLVLRDLAENRLPLGFATNRGMGEIEVAKITLQGKNLDSIISGDILIEIKERKFIVSENTKILGGENWWTKN